MRSGHCSQPFCESERQFIRGAVRYSGSRLGPAALRQGVIASKDVERLLDSGVEVFWSHDLATFANWVDGQV